jgi:hypothetical protein
MTTDAGTIKRLAFAAALATTVALAGCGHQKEDWQQAQQQNTVAAYQNFAQKYPDSDEAKQARQRIAQIKQQQQEQADWRSAQQANSIESYQQFLQKHPDSSHADRARQSVANLQRQADWQNIQNSNDVQTLQAFADKYPGSPEAAQAQQQIQQLQAQAEQARKEAQQRKQQQAKPKGNYQVQLAAFTDQAAADKAMKNLQGRLKDVLGSTSLEVEPPPQGSNYYRLKTAPMSRQDANNLCQSLKDNGQDCLVVKR